MLTTDSRLLLNYRVLRNVLIILIALMVAQSLIAQEQPPVKVNVLNVCSPTPEEQQEISAALARIPQKSSFSQDFEIDRGRSVPDQAAATLVPGAQTAQLPSDTGPADWVRIRREFPTFSSMASVQYSFSRDAKSMVETLVFRVRDPKDVMQIAVEDSAASVTTPASMLATDTPASRIKLERYGKSSIVLARCSGSEGSPAPDQSAYEPLFKSASTVAAKYRSFLGVRQTVPEEMSRISTASGAKPGRTHGNAGAPGKSQSLEPKP